MVPPESPRVAILLAAYDGMQWIEEQVTSILQQEGVLLSLYISVDRSSDGTEQWCCRLAEVDSRVTLLPTGQRYGSATQNFLRLLREVDFSTYAYVGFADQDDIWDRRKLRHAIESIQHSRYAAYSGNVEAFWPDGKRRLIRKSQPQREYDFLFEAAGPGCTYVMKQALVCDLQQCLLGHPDAASQLEFHDWFCYAYARGVGYDWYIDDESFMRYRQHDSNAVGVNEGVKPFVARARRLLRGNSLEQTALLQSLCVGPQKDADRYVLPAGRMDFLRMALTASKYRRRFRDQCFFGCFCLLKALLGGSS